MACTFLSLPGVSVLLPVSILFVRASKIGDFLLDVVVYVFFNDIKSSGGILTNSCNLGYQYVLSRPGDFTASFLFSLVDRWHDPGVLWW